MGGRFHSLCLYGRLSGWELEGPGTTHKGTDPALLGPVRQQLEGLCFQVDTSMVVVESRGESAPHSGPWPGLHSS